MNASDLLAKLERKVITLRGQDILLDRDLSKMLGTSTSNLLEKVSKNKNRFPQDFAFPLKKKEVQKLVEKGHLTKKQAKNLAKPPLAFTESGAYMASFLLKSKPALKLSLHALRQIRSSNQ